MPFVAQCGGVMCMGRIARNHVFIWGSKLDESFRRCDAAFGQQTLSTCCYYKISRLTFTSLIPAENPLNDTLK